MSEQDAVAAAREAVALAEKATPGPWDEQYVYDAVRHIARNCRDINLGGEDCEFAWDRYEDSPLIAHAGTHYATVARALLAAHEREREASELLNRARAWLAITDSAQAEKLVEAIDRWHDAALRGEQEPRDGT